MLKWAEWAAGLCYNLVANRMAYNPRNPIKQTSQSQSTLLEVRVNCAFDQTFFNFGSNVLAPTFEYINPLFCRVGGISIDDNTLELFNFFAWDFREPGRIDILYFLSWLWICLCCWARDPTDPRWMWRKSYQNIRQTGHWMLETHPKVLLQPQGAYYHH